jgi:hypothetical protein
MQAEYEQREHRRSVDSRKAALGQPSLKAMRLLEASNLNEARAHAAVVLERARQCRRCRSLLSHVFDRLGSTLFLDDDPEALALAFDPDECDPFAPTVIAAFIAVAGRKRLDPLPPTPATLH